ncbi:MAG: hypothetical protein K8F31_08165, partial [Roseovarius sp.]|nr:hypothetical protein [Roseovarius sp.]
GCPGQACIPAGAEVGEIDPALPNECRFHMRFLLRFCLCFLITIWQHSVNVAQFSGTGRTVTPAAGA